MKQKRSKTQSIELDNKAQNQSDTANGGNLDRSAVSGRKDIDCSSGVCSVTWKPDALKR